MKTRRITYLIGVILHLILFGNAICYQPIKVVDWPTAGLLPRATYRIGVNVYSEGGVILSLGTGLTDYFNFGISYGGINVIGTGDPDMNPRPEVSVKLRVLEESIVLPAVAIGFDSQGYGVYIEEASRYTIKSKGLYAVASKNWDFGGPLSLHGGISYSFEARDDDNDPTIFFGVTKSFGGGLGLALEYDFVFNDNECKSGDFLIENRGLLNASVVWNINENFSLSVDVRDIISKDSGEAKDLRRWNRGISIRYCDFF